MTTHPPLATVILAAGEGSRMRSSTPKALHNLCGRTLLGHVVALASELDAARTCIVLAEDTVAQVQAAFGPRYDYVVQRERRGTGHAVMQARPLLANTPGLVVVLYMDTPLFRPASVQALLADMATKGAVVGLISFEANPPTGYGRVIRDEAGRVTDLIEERNATAAQRAITEANSGVMAFDAAWLWEHLPKVPVNPVKNEIYLTDLVSLAVQYLGPGVAVAHQVADASEAWGINDQQQLAQAASALRARMNGALLRAGVHMPDPATVYIDCTATVAPGALLLPGTHVLGTSTVAAGAVLGPHTTVQDAVIGAGAHVPHAVVVGANVAAGTQLAPFTQLRLVTEPAA